MTWTKLETAVILGVVCLFATASAGGTKGYGDECVIGLIAGIGVGNEADTCKEDANLVCLGKTCSCNPAGFVHQSGFLGIEFLGGGCRIRANLPCSDSGTSCVSHSTCKNVCLCDEGYHNNFKDGDCTSGAFKMGGSVLQAFLLVGGLLTYFRY